MAITGSFPARAAIDRNPNTAPMISNNHSMNSGVSHFYSPEDSSESGTTLVLMAQDSSNACEGRRGGGRPSYLIHHDQSSITCSFCKGAHNQALRSDGLRGMSYLNVLVRPMHRQCATLCLPGSFHHSTVQADQEARLEDGDQLRGPSLAGKPQSGWWLTPWAPIITSRRCRLKASSRDDGR
jgi:hypothetical protein